MQMVEATRTLWRVVSLVTAEIENDSSHFFLTRWRLTFPEEITFLEFVAAESLEGIAKTEQSITLNLCENDLDVFQFILTFTRCADATSLLQSNVDETPICATKRFLLKWRVTRCLTLCS